MSGMQASCPFSMMQLSRTPRVSGQAQQILRGGDEEGEEREEEVDRADESGEDEEAEGDDVSGVSEVVIADVGMAGAQEWASASGAVRSVQSREVR